MIQGILDCTSIPVMAKSRIGHDGESESSKRWVLT